MKFGHRKSSLPQEEQTPLVNSVSPQQKVQKPFYRRWWGITLIVIVVLFILGLIGKAFEQPVAVPRVTGMKVQIAKKILESKGFNDIDVSNTSQDSTNRDNAIVIRQSPQAGKKVDTSDTTIELITRTVKTKKEKEAESELEKAKKEKPKDPQPTATPNKANNALIDKKTGLLLQSDMSDACVPLIQHAIVAQYPYAKYKVHSLLGLSPSYNTGTPGVTLIKIGVTINKANFNFICQANNSDITTIKILKVEPTS